MEKSEEWAISLWKKVNKLKLKAAKSKTIASRPCERAQRITKFKSIQVRTERKGGQKQGFYCVRTLWMTPYSKRLCWLFTWKCNHMEMSDQQVMKIWEPKVNCLAIFNFLDNNLCLLLSLVKSDDRQELCFNQLADRSCVSIWQMRTEENWKLKIKAHKNNLLLFYYK